MESSLSLLEDIPCREDLETASGLDVESQVNLWHDIAAGAASGWDFSSRWLSDGMNLSTCHTTNILPADLNSYLYRVSLPVL